MNENFPHKLTINSESKRETQWHYDVTIRFKGPSFQQQKIGDKKIRVKYFVSRNFLFRFKFFDILQQTVVSKSPNPSF